MSRRIGYNLVITKLMMITLYYVHVVSLCRLDNLPCTNLRRKMVQCHVYLVSRRPGTLRLQTDCSTVPSPYHSHPGCCEGLT